MKETQENDGRGSQLEQDRFCSDGMPHSFMHSKGPMAIARLTDDERDSKRTNLEPSAELLARKRCHQKDGDDLVADFLRTR